MICSKGATFWYYIYQNCYEELLGYDWLIYKWVLIFIINQFVLKGNWGVHTCFVLWILWKRDGRIYFFSSSFILSNLLTLTVAIKVSLLPPTNSCFDLQLKSTDCSWRRRRKTHTLIHFRQNLQNKMISIHIPITLQNKLVNCKNENYF